MTGLTTHKADWKGNFLVVDQQTLNDLGGKADEFLAVSDHEAMAVIAFRSVGCGEELLRRNREAFAQSMREAVYRAHAEALQNYKTSVVPI